MSIYKNAFYKNYVYFANCPGIAVKEVANSICSRGFHLGLRGTKDMIRVSELLTWEKLASSFPLTSGKFSFQLLVITTNHSFSNSCDFLTNGNHRYFHCCCQYLEILSVFHYFKIKVALIPDSVSYYLMFKK